MFMSEHVAIHEANNVHMELLTLTTSCQMYNLFEEALTREASKVLKSRAEGKLESGEQERASRRRRGCGNEVK